MGAHLCAALRRAGWHPVILDLRPPSGGDFEFHHGDVSDLGGSLAWLLDGVAAVYHLAWSSKPQAGTGGPVADVEANIVGGLRLLEALVRMRGRPRLVFVSSGGALYGDTTAERIGEDHPTFPLNAYGVGKLSFEHYLRLYDHLHQLDYLTLRPSNPYGELQNPRGDQGAVVVFLGKLAAEEPLTVWGDGGVVRDYLYVGDLAAALVAALGYRPGPDDPRVFNVGSGEGVSIRQLIREIERVTGRQAAVIFREARKVDASRVVLDTRKIGEHLGWRPATDLETGLTRTWNWILESQSQG